jgi:transposase-like protein
MDDAYVGGARSGRRGRGAAGKTPFVAAIATTDDGKPDQIILRPGRAFSSFAIRMLASTALEPGANIVSDGLACFTAVTQAGCIHASIKTGSGKQAARTPAFKWVNTALGNIKAALVGTYRAVREKHVPRYLAEFEYRFNRRYHLETMIPRLAFVALRTAPMPYRLLKLADVAA